MNEALIVKLGLDRAGFENGLRAAVQDAEKAGQQLKAGSLASAQAMADSHGIAIASSGKLKHALRDVTSEILSGGSATDVFTASALKLAGVMKIGLGAAAGLAVGGVIIKQVMEINDAADELRKHIGRIGQPINGADYSSLDGLKTRLDEIRKTSGELKTEMGGGFLSQMAQIAGGAGWKGAGMIAASAVLGPVYAAVGTGLAAQRGAHSVADRRDNEQGTLDLEQA